MVATTAASPNRYGWMLPRGGGATVLLRLALADSDFAAAEHLMAARGLTNRADVIRFSLAQQVARDAVYGAACRQPAGGAAAEAARRLLDPPPGDGYREAVDLIRLGVGVSQRRARGISGDVPLRQWSMHAGDNHRAAIAEISAAWGLDCLVDAVRLALRAQATVDGFRPPGGVWY